MKWELYPTLPNDRLVDSVSIDDETMFLVSKDHKLFTFSIYTSLSQSDKEKYKKGLFMQKMMNPPKQRDGSRITYIHNAWIHRTIIAKQSYRA